MNSQLNLFESEQDAKQSIAYRGGSLANRTAQAECVLHLLTSVISGRKCGASLAKLSRDGLWLKMSGDYCQAKMDGSFEEYSEILPTWGLMLDGVLLAQQTLALRTYEKDWVLLPTPRKTMATMGGHKKEETIRKKHPWNIEDELGGNPNPNYSEWLMGFPQNWTLVEMNHSETP